MIDYNRLIASAAASALGPLGFVRKGRSRLWYADHAWWAGLVEFQPTAGGGGSYLNVGAKFLWGEPVWSFDYWTPPDIRKGGLTNFHTEPPILAAERLSSAAADAARNLALDLSGLARAASHTARLAVRTNSERVRYHAAILTGLAGQPDEAVQLLSAFGDDLENATGETWRANLQEDTALLRGLETQQDIRTLVNDRIQRTRTQLRLNARAAPLV